MATLTFDNSAPTKANGAAPPDIESADLSPDAPLHGAHNTPNVAPAERIASGVAGLALAVLGATKGKSPAARAALVSAGGYLVYRGVTGHCPGYAALHTGTATDGVDSPTAVIPHGQGIKVLHSVAIAKPADELYDFWRNFENLPQFMAHLESVTVQDDKRSHWKAKAPFGKTVEWDAEIINEKPGEMIAWRSTENADVPNAGSVWFKTLPDGLGTEVKVNLEYNPPAGALGAAVAKLFGEEPNQQVKGDLARFRSLMEAGEIPNNGNEKAPIKSAMV